MDTSGLQGGFTLLEAVVVLMFLSIVLSVVAPDDSPAAVEKLNLAAEQIADAVRFARDESIRTGDVHGIEVDQTNQRITVYKADLTSSPLGQLAVLYHPVRRQLYQFVLADRPGLNGIQISNTQDPFSFTGEGRRKDLVFDSQGTPVWIVTVSNDTYQLGDGVVELSVGDSQHTVSVQPITGRVTVP